MPEGNELLKHQALILGKTLSYFRLDKWISNKVIREWTEALVFALVVATIVRTFLFAPFKIPSGSMYPTINIGDHIFATMFSYGAPIPFTDIKLFPQPIERGDIVIFPYPRDPSIDYIKRVVALAGETVQIIEDQIYINGTALKEPYAYYDPQKQHMIEQFKLTAGENMPPINNFGPVTVPAGHIFTLGDNRYNSADGRYWGFVDIKTVKGQGQLVYWSHDPEAGLFGGYRLERLFQRLK
ncbi:MAG: signal peptidase I [SAR324 cluster bacterium]|nr:signal peptidase I [SAR324 cluster bacterium]